MKRSVGKVSPQNDSIEIYIMDDPFCLIRIHRSTRGNQPIELKFRFFKMYYADDM